ncbi:MAG: hypothetical protein HOP30_09905 [Cyclobacteriaceae bacterium]|nr:hypothetical protein [Cyclobacteriaceae bacterium]
MQTIFHHLRANLIFIIPALIIALIAYVYLAPDAPVKPCLANAYIVAEVLNPGLVYSGKVTLKYRYVYARKESQKSITRHYTGLPPENFDRFYMIVCVRDSSDIVFDLVTDSIPVKPWHVMGVEYPVDSINLK